MLGEEEGGPQLGRLGGRLGAWPCLSRGMVLAKKPPSSSESSPQALLGDLTPRDWTRLLNDSYARTARLTLLPEVGLAVSDPDLRCPLDTEPVIVLEPRNNNNSSWVLSQAPSY